MEEKILNRIMISRNFPITLKEEKEIDTAVEVTNFINGQSVATGLIILIEALCDIEQNTVAELPQFI